MFKGREARLNRAIFWVLTGTGCKTIYDIHKQIRLVKRFKNTYYGNVNKRVRILEQTGYLKIVSNQTTRAGFQATVYDMTPKASLALALSTLRTEDLLNAADEDSAMEILSILAKLIYKKEQNE